MYSAKSGSSVHSKSTHLMDAAISDNDGARLSACEAAGGLLLVLVLKLALLAAELLLLLVAIIVGDRTGMIASERVCVLY